MVNWGYAWEKAQTRGKSEVTTGFWLSICRGGRIREISRNVAVIVGNLRVCATAKECRDYRRVTHTRVFDSF